ncbi:PAS domain S-box protein [Rhodoferax sp. AJA081-3]|uniref:MASE3 domain-containing protein n=1 Tax=Rhodoferax sp. AJA081-3 TaxID=2752316 RepID=UPI001ADFA6B9|nr:MASE3 domain-containing protein [Rhodoferax sp. AJA081-3]QTN28976.1 PAS domain S-box protein [Rhodoferax sp. AJA081-3]
MGADNAAQTLGRQTRLLLGAAFIAAAASLLPLDTVHIPLSAYVPAHSILEFVSIVIACLVFATAWYTPSRESSAAVVVIGIALLTAAGLDCLHLLSIVGMPDLVTPNTSQKSITFWLAARICATLGFLAASYLPATAALPRSRRRWVAAGFALYAAAVTAAALYGESSLPTFFQAGTGTTVLKSLLESALVTVLAWIAWRYYRSARASQDSFEALMFGAMGMASLTELFFANYALANDTQNLLGHLYKIASYGLIFQALFILSIRKPYQRLAIKTQGLLDANEALRVQSLALESTATPVMVTDTTGKVTWRNHASRTLKPAASEEDLNLFAPTVTPDPEVAIQMRNRLDAGEVWRGRVRLESALGQDLYLERTVTPVRNTQGLLVGYVSVSEDITEKVRTENRHRRILETALDGYWVTDTHGSLLEVNAAYARMSGYSTQELLGMRVHDLKLADEQDDIHARMLKVKQLGQDRFQSQHRKKDGSALYVEVSVNYDLATDNFFVFVRDRTEYELSAATKQDLERQLQHAQKMQALGQLTGGIAHDFNNILASILGYSNLALSRFVPDKESKLAKYLQEIVLASERARDLIAKMLTFTRTQPSGTLKAITPSLVVKEVVAMLRPSIPSSIQLRCNVESDQAIRMDAGELNQVLVNLIINARDAITEQGLIDIRVRKVRIKDALCAISHQRLSGEYLAIQVADNGCGISAENLSSVFNPFFTTKDVGKGTGLGLSMVQGILQRCGGHVVVASTLGHGSQFQLLWAAESRPPAQHSAPVRPSGDSTGTGQTVWVLDDEKAVGGYVGELLADAGYKVRVFTDPLHALSAFKTDHSNVNLLITDQTMPGLSGLQLVGLLHGIRADLPVIICTGFSQGIAAKELESHGIQRLFIKPVAADQLLQVVADILVPHMQGALK